MNPASRLPFPPSVFLRNSCNVYVLPPIVTAQPQIQFCGGKRPEAWTLLTVISLRALEHHLPPDAHLERPLSRSGNLGRLELTDWSDHH